jgi:serine phosphatase RsbU (regulator of sigma subunit)
MKIRHIILVLTAGLGLALILVAVLLLRGELSKLETAERLQASNSVRQELLFTSTGLARERTNTFIQLTTSGTAAFDRSIQDLRVRADQALARAANILQSSQVALSRAGETRAVVTASQEQLAALRAQTDEAIASDDEGLRQRIADEWLGGATQLIDDLQESRLDLLNDNRPTDAVLAAEANIRTFVDVLHEAVAYNEAIGVALLTHTGQRRNQDIITVERMAGRMSLAWQMIGNEADASLSPEVQSAIQSAESLFRMTYDPMLLSLTNAAPNLTPQALISTWEQTSDRTLDALATLQDTLLKSSHDGLNLLVEDARRSGGIVTLVAGSGIVAALLILLVVRRRVIEPLRRISHAMVEIAENNLSTPLPRARRRDEVGMMANSLRTFKANAIQRQRTQRELQKVHQDLQQTYGQMRHDLEAAATIQMTMLPIPSVVNGISHHGLYSPSSLVAGDTFNVIAQPEGGVGFFQIDVAGHGAAAALVSVAGQHTLSQALLTRRQGKPIEDILARVNREWPEDLPYFTTILGEIDSSQSVGRIVQAGHPSPMLIRADGQVESLGGSGFPVGMLQQAEYESIEFAFGTGDRLLIYSDGVVETQNPLGAFYSEERLIEFVAANADSATPELLASLQSSLWEWRGGTELTDDVSVLIVEQTK